MTGGQNTPMASATMSEAVTTNLIKISRTLVMTPPSSARQVVNFQYHHAVRVSANASLTAGHSIVDDRVIRCDSWQTPQAPVPWNLVQSGDKV
jgi:hypothetical protein